MKVDRVWQEGYCCVRPLGDGRYLAVQAMTYSKGRLVLCDPVQVFDCW